VDEFVLLAYLDEMVPAVRKRRSLLRASIRFRRVPRGSTLPASIGTGESEALCVGQASNTISARTMMASSAIEMAAPRVI
jgi:hypothetical protein